MWLLASTSHSVRCSPERSTQEMLTGAEDAANDYQPYLGNIGAAVQAHCNLRLHSSIVPYCISEKPV